MKKALLLGLLVMFVFSGSYAQKTVSGKSQSTRLVIKPKYKRGTPPNLFVKLGFEDDNNNGILEPNEGAALKLSINENSCAEHWAECSQEYRILCAHYR